jgi:RimJ/RimL family protein N-acetyltransferase
VLRLPPGVVTLEDSFTAANHRGKGLAGAAWTEIAKGLRATGVEAIITKVEVENIPSRKAVLKAGFREVSVMHLRRRGRHETVEIERLHTELTPVAQRTSDEIAKRLER